MTQSTAVSPPPYWLGLPLAIVIIALYLWSWLGLLQADIQQMSGLMIVGAIALRTFLHTGLFITAHDAIHGTICPRWPWLNHAIGAIAMFLYALFLYPIMRRQHLQHHQTPATPEDPDYSPRWQDNAFLWYGAFIWRYLQGIHGWVVLGGMTLLLHSLHFVGHVAYPNLVIFWVIPNFLSSWQLFYFGIYLPHRQPPTPYPAPHRSTTLNWTTIWSLLACYHFGYHWEHHEYPQVPWHQLPAYRTSNPSA
ncbi:MAG: beta-carotene ketolase [Spirulina sp. SIO3F2]|nr:beta-carotene ketolase [Spirulina sp. SIO3F2]